MKLAGGQYANLLELAKAVTCSPAADASFPIANLYDGAPSKPFKFGSAPADPYITVDLDRLGGYGDMEAWTGGTPNGWTEVNTGTGAVTQDVVNFHGGASAALMTGGTGSASIYRDTTVRAGERLTLEAWLAGDGTASARIRVQNLQTGKYLTSAGAWQVAAADVDSRSIASYAQTLKDFTVEGYAVCQVPTVTLRITLLCNQSGSSIADDVAVYPHVNVASIHGHNIDALNALQLRSSTDAFVGVDTLEATLAMQQPAFYGYLATAIKRRWLRLKLVGTNTSAVMLGEFWLAYAETASRGAQWGFTVITVEDQVRTESEAAEVTVFSLSQHARREVTLHFRPRNATQHAEFRDDLLRRCRGGKYPAIVIPVDDEPLILHGRFPNGDALTRAFLAVWDVDIRVVESPFPFVGT